MICLTKNLQILALENPQVCGKYLQVKPAWTLICCISFWVEFRKTKKKTIFDANLENQNRRRSQLKTNLCWMLLGPEQKQRQFVFVPDPLLTWFLPKYLPCYSSKQPGRNEKNRPLLVHNKLILRSAGIGKLNFDSFCRVAVHFLEEDDEVMQKELKEAFRLYDKEGKHAFFSPCAAAHWNFN